MAVRATRIAQITEALADLEAVFADPSCFHSPGSVDPRPVQDYAASLASEFVGAHRDDEVTGRLAKLVDAEDAGSPKDARRRECSHRLAVTLVTLPPWARKSAT